MCFLNFTDLRRSVSHERKKGSHCGPNSGVFLARCEWDFLQTTLRRREGSHLPLLHGCAFLFV